MMMDRWRSRGMDGHEMAEEGMSARSEGAAYFRFRRGDAMMDIGLQHQCQPVRLDQVRGPSKALQRLVLRTPDIKHRFAHQ